MPHLCLLCQTTQAAPLLSTTPPPPPRTTMLAHPVPQIPSFLPHSAPLFQPPSASPSHPPSLTPEVTAVRGRTITPSPGFPSTRTSIAVNSIAFYPALKRCTRAVLSLVGPSTSLFASLGVFLMRVRAGTGASVHGTAALSSAVSLISSLPAAARSLPPDCQQRERRVS